MCSKNSEKTLNQNRELYDICANKSFKRDDIRNVQELILKKLKDKKKVVKKRDLYGLRKDLMLLTTEHGQQQNDIDSDFDD